jgi:hypothetical protein
MVFRELAVTEIREVRHMFVWLSSTQTLAAFITGCEAAWGFFGVFKVIVPDNVSAIVADAVSPRLTMGQPPPDRPLHHPRTHNMILKRPWWRP